MAMSAKILGPITSSRLAAIDVVISGDSARRSKFKRPFKAFDEPGVACLSSSSMARTGGRIVHVEAIRHMQCDTLGSMDLRRSLRNSLL